MTDTIAAIATPPGSGGIGVIRISGPRAFDIAAALFSKTKCGPQKCPAFESHKVYHGYIFGKNKQVIDEVLLIPMKGPSSYTAEDVVEIQAHSGTIVLRTLLEAILSQGARLSEPGEFTKRAFLNQRIDLTQAEAVADIITAKSASALKFAASQNLGVLKTQVRELREKLIVFLSLLEVSIDFPDDVDPFEPTQQAMDMIDDVLGTCRGFVQQHEDACFLKEGIRITICGAPNVGKSSLMNRLVQQDRSIVTAIPGTTRDPIEEGLNIQGIPFVIADTAGIHQTDDLVEIIGIEKAKDHIIASDLVLFLKEPGTAFSDKEFETVVPLGKKTIFVVNKIDLYDGELPRLPEKYQHIPQMAISALLNKGIQQLKEKIVNLSLGQLDMERSSVIPNLRHKRALEQTIDSLEAVTKGVINNPVEELLAIDIKNSVDSLGTITGETASLDILDAIFSNFCIGK
ncbi:MAG: tRNA uridine-5-carboxymethylaminomethyl(34) synthesis GTPase MnmE [Desulfobacula sp.]|nr:tRNA uridine-5-carboxymethylaminomethyl(34) synthesis GTPase MnmE [Desulfobacula sp.]